jgi:polynucleotide 5'-hydroxyl-kinase GRC3/NOL9
MACRDVQSFRVSIEVPCSWQTVLARLENGTGTVVVIGECDSGKSTFCALAASRAAQAATSRPVAVVDADVGQSDIGPPACVSTGLVRAPIERLDQVPAEAMEFVGATSPVGHLLQCATATARMAQKARESAVLVIVDTTGLVHGGIARALKSAKMDLLQPWMVVALQRESELESLLAPYRHRAQPVIARLQVARSVVSKSVDERRQRRKARFAQYFRGARSVEIGWESVTLEGSAFLSGQAMAGQFCAYAEGQLGCEVVRIERTSNGLLALVRGEPDSRARREASQEGYEVERLSRFDNLLVGLIDRKGETIGLGIVERVDLDKRRFALATPVETAQDVACLRLGSMRLLRDGTELGEA